MVDLSISGVSVDIQGRRIIDDVSLKVGAGELVALLGPNGAGKTTLLRAALGLAPIAAGQVRLGGDDPVHMKPSERARLAAYLPQTRPLAWPLLVRDVVALGRFAHGAGIGKLRGKDEAAVERALEACELVDLAHRDASTLSGGERARMHIARALAAAAPLLIADEPIAALDPLHAWRVMELLAKHAADGGSALVVLHDAALAGRFASRIAMQKAGRLIADGRPSQVLTPDLLAEIYGVRAEVSVQNGFPAMNVLGPV